MLPLAAGGTIHSSSEGISHVAQIPLRDAHMFHSAPICYIVSAPTFSVADNGVCQGNNSRLHNQHPIAEGVEAVLLGDGLAVGLQHQVPAGEGADQHQQGGPG